MHQPSLSELRTQFAQIEGVHFAERTSGLPEIHIENRFCEAVVSLQGGQVLSYTQKADGRDLLFCSKKAYFESGKGIKGGAPICWPWFGEHPDGLGAHGFARKTLWQADQITTDDCGVTEVTLSTCTTPETEQYWPYQAKLSTNIRLGKWLSISLCTTNLGPEPLPLTQAIHTYFQVADIKAVKVSGLESHAYYDKVQDFALTPASKREITFAGELDRIYQGTAQPITILDQSLKRKIAITSEGSDSTIVWNPWVEKSIAMADFGDDEFHHMLCVETANAADDARQIEPGASHTLAVNYRLEAL